MCLCMCVWGGGGCICECLFAVPSHPILLIQLRARRGNPDTQNRRQRSAAVLGGTGVKREARSDLEFCAVHVNALELP